MTIILYLVNCSLIYTCNYVLDSIKSKTTEEATTTQPSERDRDRHKGERSRDRDKDRSRSRHDREHRDDISSRSGGVETVDRGVGPTPIPPPLVDQRVPPFYGIPPYPDPRNGLVDAHMGKQLTGNDKQMSSD